MRVLLAWSRLCFPVLGSSKVFDFIQFVAQIGALSLCRLSRWIY